MDIISERFISARELFGTAAEAAGAHRPRVGIPLKAMYALGFGGDIAAKVLRHGLTPREMDVLAQLAEGLSNRQIARLLSISERTVGVHVSNVLAKLGVNSRSEAAAMSFQQHLLDDVTSR